MQNPTGHLITIQALGALVTITTLQRHSHIIEICNLPCQLPTNIVNVEADRKLKIRNHSHVGFLLNDPCSPRLMEATRITRIAVTEQHGYVTKGGKSSSATFIYIMYILFFSEVQVSERITSSFKVSMQSFCEVGLGIKIDPK